MKITINTITNQITEDLTSEDAKYSTQELKGYLNKTLCEYLADKIYQQESTISYNNELLELATDLIESCINEHVREDWS